MEDGHGARGRHPEHRAEIVRSAFFRRSVEVAICRSQERGFGGRPVGAARERIHDRDNAGGGHPEDGSRAGRAAARRRAVEISVGSLNETGLGIETVAADTGKDVQHGHRAGRRHRVRRARIARPHRWARTVEIAVSAQHQSVLRICTIYYRSLRGVNI